MGCASGFTGTVLEPQVTYEAEQIVITTVVEPLDDEAATCPSNEWVAATVELSEPIGDRELIDGLCLEAEYAGTAHCMDPARWP